jgi:hypothetical protein
MLSGRGGEKGNAVQLAALLSLSIASPAPTSALVRYAAKGSDISARFLTALPRCLALPYNIRFSLVGIDACSDIRTAIERLRR